MGFPEADRPNDRFKGEDGSFPTPSWINETTTAVLREWGWLLAKAKQEGCNSVIVARLSDNDESATDLKRIGIVGSVLAGFVCVLFLSQPGAIAATRNPEADRQTEITEKNS